MSEGRKHRPLFLGTFTSLFSLDGIQGLWHRTFRVLHSRNHIVIALLCGRVVGIPLVGHGCIGFRDVVA